MLPIRSLTFGDYLVSWGFATQKFSPSFHAKNHMLTKEIKITHSLPKSHSLPTKSPHQRNQCPTKKKKKIIIDALPKFNHNQNFSHVQTQLPKISHNQSHKKFLHVQSSHKIFLYVHAQQKNSHISITYLTKFSIAKISCP